MKCRSGMYLPIRRTPQDNPIAFGLKAMMVDNYLGTYFNHRDMLPQSIKALSDCPSWNAVVSLLHKGGTITKSEVMSVYFMLRI